MPTKRCIEETDAVEAFPSPHPSPNKRLKKNHATWSVLPGEIRNTIYEHCLAMEAKLSHSITYRSSSAKLGLEKLNLGSGSASSTSSSPFWSLTQANRQTRAEFKPWLQKTRRVETPLATLNEYIDVFLPAADEQSTTHTAWIKPLPPLHCGIPLPTGGINITSLIQHRPINPSCLLEQETQHNLDPTSDVLCALYNPKAWLGHCEKPANITSLTLAPYQTGVWDGEHEVPCRVSSPSIHDKIMLKIKCGPSLTPEGQQPEQHMRLLAHWFFYEAELDLCQDVVVLLSVPGYKTMWTVLEPGFAYATWERFGDGREIVFRTHWKVKSKIAREGGEEVETVVEREWYDAGGYDE